MNTSQLMVILRNKPFKNTWEGSWMKLLELPLHDLVLNSIKIGIKMY